MLPLGVDQGLKDPQQKLGSRNSCPRPKHPDTVLLKVLPSCFQTAGEKLKAESWLAMQQDELHRVDACTQRHVTMDMWS